MKTEFNATEARKNIVYFFNNMYGKSCEDIRKIKRLAMHYHVPLHAYKELFCKKCFSVFNAENSEIRIKKGVKIVKCKECECVSRYDLRKD